MSKISILIGTQDENLRQLCMPFASAENFYLFDDIHQLSSKIEEISGQIAVFVDIEWPNNNSGYHVSRALRKRNDHSKTFLLTDRTDDVKLHWANKVNGEILERNEEAFLTKFMSFIALAKISIEESEVAHFDEEISKTLTRNPVRLVEEELEKILGPMGPILLQDALAATNGNLCDALKKVATFGTTETEQNQVTELSVQFG